MYSLANAVAGLAEVSETVTGVWQRHLPARFRDSALEGRSAYSRWGRKPGFPLLYLGRPTTSVTVEAYRHLVDPVVDDPNILDHLTPRVLATIQVHVTEILDLRTARARMELRLPLDQIQSPTDDRSAYAACQEVAAAAHQHGFHGLVTPAATGLGETLALFTDNLPEVELPKLTEVTAWDSLPDDPRIQGRLRLL